MAMNTAMAKRIEHKFRIIASFFLAAALIAALGCVSSSAKNEALAKCLTSKGAVMYGAYWCPHCQNQKTAFGDAFKYINYTECDAKGQNGNPQACKDAGIQGFPTWIIAGQQYSGEQDLSTLAKIAGC